MTKVRFDKRTIEILDSANDPVEPIYFERFVINCRKIALDPTGVNVLRSLSRPIETIYVKSSRVSPMTWGQGISSATVTIHPTEFFGLKSKFDRQIFDHTVVHEMLHGSDDINVATESVISFIVHDNPSVKAVIDGDYSNFREVVEHAFVKSGAHIVSNEIFGYATEGYVIKDAELFLRNKYGALKNEPLNNIQKIFDMHTPSALPGIAPQSLTS